MRYLLDSNAVSDLARQRPTMVERYERAIASGATVDTSVIVVGESERGILQMPNGRKRDDVTREVGAVLARLRVLPVPVDAGPIYAALRLGCGARGYTRPTMIFGSQRPPFQFRRSWSLAMRISPGYREFRPLTG